MKVLMRSDDHSREGLPVPVLTAIVGPSAAPAENTISDRAAFASYPDLGDEFESLSIPNRGIVLGFLASSFLWAALILAARALWLLLR
jgi:hypothetical protein